ncbi:MAG: PilT/PilU family type 4a pilus ATPase [Longimicrobiales bacterium]|nr:PilT/PilU family type 4a pilus ATPase [Longimicrobiales bacterium]
MAQLDRFIKALHDHGADMLTLAVEEPPALVRGGTPHHLSKQSLTDAQYWGLLQEVAEGSDAEKVAAREAVAFPYAAPSGAVVVAMDLSGSTPRATLRPAATTPVAPASREAPGAATGRGRAQVDELLRRLVSSHASDLHLRVGQPAIFRRDGRLAREGGEAMHADGIQAMLDAIAPERDRVRHAERWDADFAYEIQGLARFRVNAAMDRGGPMVVFRVIPSKIPTCEQLNVPKEVQALTMLTKGLVVITGPTGSGKSTTLAALVNKMNDEREDHILTIEDPIEFVHESKKCLVTHRQVGQHTESFKSGLRAALREDPDIVLIGELRDLETVAIAIETAETGHLVFGTLHTTTAASTVDRIIDQFPADRQAQIRVMLSESLRGVISQTLCRKKGGGRVAAREILLTTPAISNLIREGKTFQIPSIIQTSRKFGMITLNDALLDLVDRKVVESHEAYMKAVEKTSLVTALKARGHDVSFLGE